MAAMYVIGIDFGNESSYIAVPKSGGIETISNDFSLRATPSCVAFSNRNRIIGVAAKNQLITNLKNTIFSFKRLLGKKFDDPYLQHELRYLPFEVKRTQDGGVGVQVHYLDETHVFSVQQITAMFFTKLKETAEAALKCDINQCVISVPSFFDNAERQALLDAASIAGLKVLRIFNETAATALTYGIYKQDLPNANEPARHMVFVDCGHTSLQVSACSFNKGKLKLLACASDPRLGGRDFDIILAEHLSADFAKRYNIEPTKNTRAFLRLLGEVEKLKKQMSANSTKLPLNIECFMNDKDVHAEMKRDDMETLCADLFDRVEKTMTQCLEESKLHPNDIYAVEIVGGSTRIPAIKKIIEKIFGMPPSTTLNVDEAVARGCALQCAMLCPAILIRDFSIVDIQNDPIQLSWDPFTDEIGTMDVFPHNHPIPSTKALSLYRKEPFVLKATYGLNNKSIGQFIVNGVKPDAKGDNQKVKVKARVDINGVFSIVNAVLVEKTDVEEQTQPMDVSPSQNDEPPLSEQPQPQQPAASEENNVPTTEASAAAAAAADTDVGATKQEKKDRRKRPGSKISDLPVQIELVGAYNQNEINNFTEAECKMVASDRQERDRVDARNALEEYVYELRGKLSSPDELARYVPDADRQKLCCQLDDIENWLYAEGEECQRHIYSDKLQSLREVGEPIKKRKTEYEALPGLLEEFSSMLQLTRKAIDEYKAGDEKYAHLEQSEIGTVEQSTQKAWKWVDETFSRLRSNSYYTNPSVSSEQVKTEKMNFQSQVSKILCKPKPQPPPSATATANPQQPQETKEQQQQQQQQPPPPSSNYDENNQNFASNANNLPNGDKKN